MKADLILYNANAITLDPKKPKANLIAIKKNRILEVGDHSLPEILTSSKTKLINCHGKTVVPGFNDAHCHPFALASSLLGVDCSPAQVTGINDIKVAIHQRAQKTPPGKWIKATGYNEFYLTEKRHPNRWDLDEATSNHPVKLNHRSGHACVLNSLALSLVGISRETADPPGGIIDRDLQSGEPTGLLFEMNRQVDQTTPRLTADELERGMKFTNQTYLSQGITSVQDATASNDFSQWQSYLRLQDIGILKSRVYMMISTTALSSFMDRGLVSGSRDEHLRLGSVKIIVDETTGDIYPSEDKLTQQVLQAHRAGFQVALHAIEERPLKAAASALEQASSYSHRPNLRHRIEHCSICPPELLEHLKKIGVVIVSQPPFIYYSGERYLAEISPQQLQWLYRFKSLLEAGLTIAGSSDSPVVPNSPLVGICAAINRKASAGQVILPEEKITLPQALAMYTINAAYASREEKIKGTISKGKLADLVILDAELHKIPTDEIKNIGVVMTIIDGNIVWEI